MVCLRCKLLVEEELLRIGISFTSVEMGNVALLHVPSHDQRETLKANLIKSGLELLDDKKQILVEKIKNLITELINNPEALPVLNYSEFISHKLSYDYTYLANTFSKVEGVNIQQFIIQQKIQKVKQLLIADEYNLTQIAYKLHYSSVAHLSNQFKKTTGLTPSAFKKSGIKHEIMLQNV